MPIAEQGRKAKLKNHGTPVAEAASAKMAK